MGVGWGQGRWIVIQCGSSCLFSVPPFFLVALSKSLPPKSLMPGYPSIVTSRLHEQEGRPTPLLPARRWKPPTFLTSVYGEVFPSGQSGLTVKLITRHHCVETENTWNLVYLGLVISE